MSAAAAALAHVAPARAGRKLASGIFTSLADLASGSSDLQPANDTGENQPAYDRCTSESCYWTAKDPIGFGGDGPNLYAYVESDPVNQLDPSGRKKIWWKGGIADDCACIACKVWHGVGAKLCQIECQNQSTSEDDYTDCLIYECAPIVSEMEHECFEVCTFGISIDTDSWPGGSCTDDPDDVCPPLAP